MKKRYLIPLIVLGMGAVGTAAGFSVNAYYQSKANEVAQLVEVQEGISASEDLTEEEKSKLQIVIEQLTAKYNEIKNIQVAGTTIGAIAGSLVGAIVGLIPALVNRSNIHEALSFTRSAKKQTEDNGKLLEVFKEKFEITDKKYNEVIEANKLLGVALEKTEKRLEKSLENQERISNENKELKEIMLIYMTNDKNAVANGIAELLSKKYLNK